MVHRISEPVRGGTYGRSIHTYLQRLRNISIAANNRRNLSQKLSEDAHDNAHSLRVVHDLVYDRMRALVRDEREYSSW